MHPVHAALFLALASLACIPQRGLAQNPAPAQTAPTGVPAPGTPPTQQAPPPQPSLQPTPPPAPPPQPPQPPLANEIRVRDFFNPAQTLLDCGKVPDSGPPNQKKAAQLTSAALRGTWQEVGTLLREHSDKPQALEAYSALLEKIAQTSQVPKFRADSRNMYFGEMPERHDRERPHLLVAQDFMEMLGAAPGELNPGDIATLSKIGKVALHNADKQRLAEALERGLGALGGPSPDARAQAASVLTALGEPALAKSFLPTSSNPKDPALSLTQLLALLEYHAALLELGLPEGSHSVAAAVCTALSGRIPNADKETRLRLARRLQPLINAMDPAPAEAFLKTEVLPDAALTEVYAAHLQESAPASLRANTEKARKDALLAQVRFLNAHGKAFPLSAEALAALVLPWTDEAESALRYTPDRKESEDSRKAIADIYGFSERPSNFLSMSRVFLLENAPSEEVIEKLGAALAQRLRLLKLRLEIGDPAEETLTRLRAFLQRYPESRMQLCTDFLESWVRQRAVPEEDPEAARLRSRGFPIPKFNAFLPLTRARQMQNLGDFRRLLTELRSLAGGALKPESEVKAFCAIHSPAEVFKREDIETAFGAPEQMDPETVATLAAALRQNLASQWDDPAVQQQQGTNRTRAEMKEAVRAGYQLAAELVRRNLANRQADSRILLAAALTLFDAAEFEFNEKGPIESYVQARTEALDMFRRAATTYNAEVPKLPERLWKLDAYLPWISSTLGATDLARLKWRDGRPESPVSDIAQTFSTLPREAAPFHRAALAKLAETSLPKVNPTMRQKFLGAVAAIVGDDLPEMRGILRTLESYKQLLAESRLVAQLDGPAEISPDQPFGLTLSIEYTNQLGRETNGFTKYLQNPGANAKANPFFAAFNAKTPPNYRDDFQKNIRSALGAHFEILSTAFHGPNVDRLPAASGKTDWGQTPLAYLVLRAKNEAVDRLPPIQLDLEFADASQQVVLPTTTQIELLKNLPNAPTPRPVPNLELVVTLDERDWSTKERLQIDIDAKAGGVIPEFRDLFEFAPEGFEVRLSDPGLAVDEFKTEQGRSAPLLSRSWQVLLTPKTRTALPERLVPPKLVFKLPTKIQYRSYRDADLVPLSKETVTQGIELRSGALRWGRISLGLGLLLAAGGFLLRKLRYAPAPAVPGNPLPEQLSPFSALRFLNLCLSAGHLSETRKSEVLATIRALEQRCFSSKTSPLSEAELRALLEKHRQDASPA